MLRHVEDSLSLVPLLADGERSAAHHRPAGEAGRGSSRRWQECRLSCWRLQVREKGGRWEGLGKRKGREGGASLIL